MKYYTDMYLDSRLLTRFEKYIYEITVLSTRSQSMPSNLSNDQEILCSCYANSMYRKVGNDMQTLEIMRILILAAIRTSNLILPFSFA